MKITPHNKTIRFYLWMQLNGKEIDSWNDIYEVVWARKKRKGTIREMYEIFNEEYYKD